MRLEIEVDTSSEIACSQVLDFGISENNFENNVGLKHRRNYERVVGRSLGKQEGYGIKHFSILKPIKSEDADFGKVEISIC